MGTVEAKAVDEKSCALERSSFPPLVAIWIAFSPRTDPSSNPTNTPSTSLCSFPWSSCQSCEQLLFLRSESGFSWYPESLCEY